MKFFSRFLTFAVSLLIFLYLNSSSIFASSITQTSEETFGLGTTDTYTDLSTPGFIKIKQDNLSTETIDQFNNGYVQPSDNHIRYSQIISGEGGGISVDDYNSFCYSDTTIPLEKVDYNQVATIASDSNSNLLYVIGPKIPGVSVIDTKGTFDPGDDEDMGYYDATSSLSIGSTAVFSLYFEPNTQLLYVATQSQGIFVIDNKSTPTLSDDELVGTYNGSTPVVVGTTSNTGLWRTTYDSSLGILYLALGSNGKDLIAIDTKNTADTSDDTQIFHYDETTTPGIASSIADIYADNTNDSVYLYTNTSVPSGPTKGLYSVDTNGTTDSADDTVYGPVLSTYYIYRMVGYQNRLFLGTDGSIKVIDTNNTPDTSDDTEIHNFSGSGDWGVVNDLYFDSVNNYLYFTSVANGVYIINADTGAQVAHYDRSTHDNADLSSNWSIELINGNIFTSGRSVCGINPNGNIYYDQAIFESNYFYNQSFPLSASWTQNLNSGASGNVSFQVRYGVGDTSYYYFNDFSSNTNDVISDYYSWGTFGTQTVANGIVSFTNPTGYDYLWLHTGHASGYYPQGTKFTVKLRASGPTAKYLTVFPEDWSVNEFITRYDLENDDWQIITFTPSVASNSIGFEFTDDGSTWQAEDSIDIDWVRIENVAWDSWQNLGSDNTLVNFSGAQDKNFFQYRFDLNSFNNNQSAPIVNSVDLNNGYYSQSVFTSTIIDAGTQVSWDELTLSSSTPGSSSVVAYTRTGNTSTPDGTWSDWQAINSPIASPDNTQYIQYKLVLNSDQFNSPSVDAVTITYNTGSSSTPTSTPTTTSTNTDTNPSPPSVDDPYQNVEVTTSPDLFSIDTTSTSATLHFSPVSGTNSYYLISYGSKKSADEFSVKFDQSQSPGAITYLIEQLKPNTNYYFKVHGGNKNTTGPWSQTVLAKTKSKSYQASSPIPTAIPSQSQDTSSDVGSDTNITPTSVQAPSPTPTTLPEQQLTSCQPQLYDQKPLSFFAQSSIKKLPTTNGTIYTMLEIPGGYLLAGNFTQVGKVSTSIAKLSKNGNIDSSCIVNIQGSVYSIVKSDTKSLVYLSGDFTSIDSQPVQNLAAIDLDSCQPVSLQAASTDPVKSIALDQQDQSLYYLTCPTSQPIQTSISQLDLGTNETTILNLTDGPIAALAIDPDDNLIISGSFGQVLGASRQNLVSINISKNQPTSWNPNPNGLVRNIIRQGNAILVAGDFSAISDYQIARYAKIDFNTQGVSTWHIDFNWWWLIILIHLIVSIFIILILPSGSKFYIVLIALTIPFVAALFSYFYFHQSYLFLNLGAYTPQLLLVSYIINSTVALISKTFRK